MPFKVPEGTLMPLSWFLKLEFLKKKKLIGMSIIDSHCDSGIVKVFMINLFIYQFSMSYKV